MMRFHNKNITALKEKQKKNHDLPSGGVGTFSSTELSSRCTEAGVTGRRARGEGRWVGNQEFRSHKCEGDPETLCGGGGT